MTIDRRYIRTQLADRLQQLAKTDGVPHSALHRCEPPEKSIPHKPEVTPSRRARRLGTSTTTAE